MKIALASDHAGYALKTHLWKFLSDGGHEVLDLGTSSADPVDYPDYAEAIGTAVREKRVERGVLLCGSGVGAAIAANKLPGIRAGLCHDIYSAHQGVEHDDMNVLVLGARVIAQPLAEELVRRFLAARFSGEERHVRRLGKVRALECRYCELLTQSQAGESTEPSEGTSSGASAEVNPLSLRMPFDQLTAIGDELREWREEGRLARLWRHDAALWTGHDEARWMDWLDVPERELVGADRFARIRDEIRDSGARDVVLLGMGGSSLAPEVFSLTFDPPDNAPEFHVLDSTDPAQIRRLDAEIDLARSIFIVSSKSGTTLEPNIFYDYYRARVAEALGEGSDPAEIGRRFIAITDPGSALEKVAARDGFRAVFHGVPGIGGRYSALSDFGLVPAAIMGIDVPRLLRETGAMVRACGSEVSAEHNPAAILGVALGTLARAGRDKVTILSFSPAWDLGAWLEQLLAESTGKQGKGLIPVFGESVGEPASYGRDRVFVTIEMEGAEDPALAERVEALADAGHPLIRIRLNGPYSLGQELFRWELATAIAGSVLGIDPFDQPDVEASKVATRDLTSAYEREGRLPPEQPFFESGGVRLFADERDLADLRRRVASHPGADGVDGATLTDWLRAHLDRLGLGDYFALLAYLDRSSTDERLVGDLREQVRAAKRVATCVGFGPRFLHSTGQAYKGGPASGVFLQVTADDADDLPVPGHRYGFGVVKAAQARGDLQVLVERGRRCLRAHLTGADPAEGLARLRDAVAEALPSNFPAKSTPREVA